MRKYKDLQPSSVRLLQFSLQDKLLDMMTPRSFCDVKVFNHPFVCVSPFMHSMLVLSTLRINLFSKLHFSICEAAFSALLKDVVTTLKSST